MNDCKTCAYYTKPSDTVFPPYCRKHYGINLRTGEVIEPDFYDCRTNTSLCGQSGRHYRPKGELTKEPDTTSSSTFGSK